MSRLLAQPADRKTLWDLHAEAVAVRDTTPVSDLVAYRPVARRVADLYEMAKAAEAVSA